MRFAYLKQPVFHGLDLGRRGKLKYYACRYCRRTVYGRTGIQNVVCVLDENCPYEISHHGNTYFVSYFAHRMLFDFNRIEIINASDKVIEKFCLQVYHDKDIFRKENRKFVKCLVSPNAGINNWSRKILEDVFTTVVAPG